MKLPADSGGLPEPADAPEPPGAQILRYAPGAPDARPPRIIGAMILGAVIGSLIALIWTETHEAQLHACAGPGLACLAPVLIGLIAGTLLVIVGSLLGFTFLRVRPLAVAVILASVLTLFMVLAADAAVLSGQPPAWALILLVAAGYGVLATTILVPGVLRLAGGTLLAAMLVASRIVPGLIHQGQQQNDQQTRVRALAFPLTLPAVPGYKIASVYPSGDTLSVWMVADSARRDRFGVYDSFAFTVTIGPVSDQYLSLSLTACESGQTATPPPPPADQASTEAIAADPNTPPSSAPGCHVLSADQWAVTGGGTTNVIARHGAVAVEASENIPPAVPVSTLARATTSLRPATATAIVALETGH